MRRHHIEIDTHYDPQRLVILDTLEQHTPGTIVIGPRRHTGKYHDRVAFGCWRQFIRSAELRRERPDNPGYEYNRLTQSACKWHCRPLFQNRRGCRSQTQPVFYYGPVVVHFYVTAVTSYRY